MAEESLSQKVDALLSDPLEQAQQAWVSTVWQVTAEAQAGGTYGSSTMLYAIDQGAREELRKRSRLITDAWMRAMAGFPLLRAVTTHEEAIAHASLLLSRERERLQQLAPSIDLSEAVRRLSDQIAVELEIAFMVRRQPVGEEMSTNNVEIFISHSSVDLALAELLVDLLRSSLNLTASCIRCTSVEGHRLPGGAHTAEQLRSEILSSPVFIGLISASSLESAYVLFELGARWGAARSLIPLLVPGLTPSELRGPITGLNALTCESGAQLHQLVQEIASALSRTPEKPAAYQAKIDAILAVAARAITNQAPPTDVWPRLVAQANEYERADEIIAAHCERRWPEDFVMRAHCIREQAKALAILKRGGSDAVPEHIFRKVRQGCAARWPDDYEMRLHCENEQLAAYRELNALS